MDPKPNKYKYTIRTSVAAWRDPISPEESEDGTPVDREPIVLYWDKELTSDFIVLRPKKGSDLIYLFADELLSAVHALIARK